MNHENPGRSGVDFDALWRCELQPLEPPNRRGRGTSSVAIAGASQLPELHADGRLYVKRQQAFFCRPPWNLFRRTPTLRRELRFIERARTIGVAVPSVVFYAEGSDDRALLILDEISGVTDLEHALAEKPVSDRTSVLCNVGAMLARLHCARILHGAVYPKHVLVEIAAPWRVWLIDFEKARQVASPVHAAEHDVARLMRHAAFLTQADIRTLVGAYDARIYSGLLQRLGIERA